MRLRRSDADGERRRAAVRESPPRHRRRALRIAVARRGLSASWSATNWLTFDVKLPWLTSFIGYGTAPYARINGLGDLELAGRFVLFRERGFAPHHLLSGAWLSFFASTGYRYTTPGWHAYHRGMSVGASALLQAQPKPWGAVQVGLDGGW
ncbi:MAG TPA: hypothetical protein VHB97_08435 [Polyangia bacterium]|nr:hypothetical protein [Polyangia bacterium]